MAINQNHLFEELDGIKCAIVEKNVSPARVDFLRRILEYNRLTVVVVPSPPPKVAAPPAPARPAAPATPEQAAPPPPAPAAESPVPPAPPPPPPPATFTVGVTDTMFNPVNAIFGRLLRAPDGHIVTLAYWQQKDERSNDAVPYFNQR
jgi:hypothetical protein